MPFKSESQRRFLWMKHPEIARKFATEYPDSNKGLPMHVQQQPPMHTQKDPFANNAGRGNPDFGLNVKGVGEGQDDEDANAKFPNLRKLFASKNNA